MAEFDQSRIDEAIAALTEKNRKLYAEALAEGFKNDFCPAANCGRLFLAHKHFLVCEPSDKCPMISKSNRNEDGSPKSMLDMLAEANPLPVANA